MKNKWGYFLFILLLINCTLFKNNKNIIPEEQLIPLLVDIHLIDGILNNIPRSERLKIKNDTIYKGTLIKHNTTREELDNTIYYYSDKPDELKKIYEEVIDILQELQEDINKEKIESENNSSRTSDKEEKEPKDVSKKGPNKRPPY